MKSALGIGGEVVSVEVVEDGSTFHASCAYGRDNILLTGQGESFDAALLSLRASILTQRSAQALR